MNAETWIALAAVVISVAAAVVSIHQAKIRQGLRAPPRRLLVASQATRP
ncbi:hypothetical protein [Streptomyces sp. NPDC058847]